MRWCQHETARYLREFSSCQPVVTISARSTRTSSPSPARAVRDAASAALPPGDTGAHAPFPVGGARLVPSNNNDVWRLETGYLRVAWRGDRSRSPGRPSSSEGSADFFPSRRSWTAEEITGCHGRLTAATPGTAMSICARSLRRPGCAHRRGAARETLRGRERRGQSPGIAPRRQSEHGSAERKTESCARTVRRWRCRRSAGHLGIDSPRTRARGASVRQYHRACWTLQHNAAWLSATAAPSPRMEADGEVAAHGDWLSTRNSSAARAGTIMTVPVTEAIPGLARTSRRDQGPAVTSRAELSSRALKQRHASASQRPVFDSLIEAMAEVSDYPELFDAAPDLCDERPLRQTYRVRRRLPIQDPTRYLMAPASLSASTSPGGD